MRDYLLRHELMYRIILGIAIGLTILMPLIQRQPGTLILQIDLPPFFPLHFPAERPELCPALEAGVLVFS